MEPNVWHLVNLKLVKDFPAIKFIKALFLIGVFQHWSNGLWFTIMSLVKVLDGYGKDSPMVKLY